MSALARSSPTVAVARCLLMVDLTLTTLVAAHIVYSLVADSYAICSGNVSLAGSHGEFYDNITAAPTGLRDGGGIFDSSVIYDVFYDFDMDVPSGASCADIGCPPGDFDIVSNASHGHFDSTYIAGLFNEQRDSFSCFIGTICNNLLSQLGSSNFAVFPVVDDFLDVNATSIFQDLDDNLDVFALCFDLLDAGRGLLAWSLVLDKETNLVHRPLACQRDCQEFHDWLVSVNLDCSHDDCVTNCCLRLPRFMRTTRLRAHRRIKRRKQLLHSEGVDPTFVSCHQSMTNASHFGLPDQAWTRDCCTWSISTSLCALVFLLGLLSCMRAKRKKRSGPSNHEEFNPAHHSEESFMPPGWMNVATFRGKRPHFTATVPNQCTSNCLWRAILDAGYGGGSIRSARMLKRMVLRRAANRALVTGDICTHEKLLQLLTPGSWANSLALCAAVQELHISIAVSDIADTWLIVPKTRSHLQPLHLSLSHGHYEAVVAKDCCYNPQTQNVCGTPGLAGGAAKKRPLEQE
eukprot:355174-Amphidinium_carterae.1